MVPNYSYKILILAVISLLPLGPIAMAAEPARAQGSCWHLWDLWRQAHHSCVRLNIMADGCNQKYNQSCTGSGGVSAWIAGQFEGCQALQSSCNNLQSQADAACSRVEQIGAQIEAGNCPAETEPSTSSDPVIAGG